MGFRERGGGIEKLQNIWVLRVKRYIPGYDEKGTIKIESKRESRYEGLKVRMESDRGE